MWLPLYIVDPTGSYSMIPGGRGAPWFSGPIPPPPVPASGLPNPHVASHVGEHQPKPAVRALKDSYAEFAARVRERVDAALYVENEDGTVTRAKPFSPPDTEVTGDYGLGAGRWQLPLADVTGRLRERTV